VSHPVTPAQPRAQPPAASPIALGQRTTSIDPDDLLVRGLGVRQLAAAIFNYTVGSSIFVLPALAVARLDGAAPLAYLLCALLIGLVVLVFAEAGSRVSATGGPYAYVEVALGPFPGLVAGVLLSLNDVTAAGAISMLLAGSLTRLLGLSGPAWQGVIVTLLLAGLAAINVRGLRWGTRLVETFTMAKLAPLLFFLVVGAFFMSPANLHWASVPSAGTVANTAGTLVFAFTGIEAALLPSGEVRDPARTVPRAAMLALASATLLYLAVQEVALGVMGPALAEDTVAPLSSAAAAFAGQAGRTLLLVGATVSMFGWLTGSILAGPRGLFALARDGFLPRQIAAVHLRFRTPHVAIATYAALALALALSGTFERLAVVSNLAALGLYFLCAIAACGAAAARHPRRGGAVPHARRCDGAGPGVPRHRLGGVADDHAPRVRGLRRRARGVGRGLRVTQAARRRCHRGGNGVAPVRRSRVSGGAA
jgi:basic amino acid/polyamine antiporter, APA family